MSHMQTVGRVARQFCAELRVQLTYQEFERMIVLNREESCPNICHSHDYTDANELMARAFAKILGQDYAGLDQHTQIINDAWELAKSLEFSL